jgi:hypothetical protein
MVLPILLQVSSILSQFSSSSWFYPFLYAALIGVIVDVALRHTTLSEGTHAIALIVAAIAFFSFLQSPALLKQVESDAVLFGILGFIFVLILIPGRGMTGSFRLGSVLVVLVMALVLLEMFPSLGSSISGALGFNIQSLVFFGIVGMFFLFALYIWYQIARRAHPFVGMLLFFILFFGGMFLFAPRVFGEIITLLVLILIIIIVLAIISWKAFSRGKSSQAPKIEVIKPKQK